MESRKSVVVNEREGKSARFNTNEGVERLNFFCEEHRTREGTISGRDFVRVYVERCILFFIIIIFWRIIKFVIKYAYISHPSQDEIFGDFTSKFC